MPNSKLRQRLGERLRDLRRKSKLTQEQLAEHAGIVPAYVSAIECAARAPTVETLASLATALKVTLSELLLGVDHPLPPQLHRLETALAGQSPESQQTILRIVSEALRLAARQSSV
jgi:transcriptional regulator with XRE-family HTH domain